MTWLLVLVGLWLLLAGVAALALAQGLAPEGSRRARVAKPLAGSIGYAKLVAAALAGAWAALRLQRREGADDAVHEQIEADAQRRARIDAMVGEAEAERRADTAELVNEADAIEAEASAEAEAIRSAPAETDLEALAARFDERTGGR